MSTERFKEGQTIPYEVFFIDQFGVGITDAVGVINIRRKSDDQYFNGTTFQVATIDLAMNEIDEVNSPGYWKFDFNTALGNAIDDYISIAKDTSGNAENIPAPRMDLVGNYIDSIETAVTVILGLSRENFVMDPTEFDTNDGEMTKGDVRIYDSPANTTTDDGSTGLIRKYTITAPRTLGLLDKFTMIRVP